MKVRLLHPALFIVVFINPSSSSSSGLPFLFRVGLALISCCRRQLILATNAELLLRHLRYPPPSCLPPDPEAFLSLVFSVKVKDEDVRKQRVKMEAHLKRQTQVRTASS
jgi:hypothetical protein